MLTFNEYGCVVFSSGRERPCYGKIIGVTQDMAVSYGFDGTLWSGEDEDLYDDPLTTADLLELADYMIEQWQKFKDYAQTTPRPKDIKP